MPRNKTKQGGATAPVRGYDNWTIGELRQKLARRTSAELEGLLAYEKGGRKRKGALDAIKRVISDAADAAKPRGRKASKGTKAARRSGTKARMPLGDVLEHVRSGVQTGMKKVRALVGFPAAEELGGFSRQAFMDRLSEFLEHERGGAKLYELGLDKEGITADQRERLREFYGQTRRHIDILSTIIVALGGDPEYRSESAELGRLKAQALIDTDTEGEVGVLNYFQNLMIAEVVDHMNWEFLTKIKGKVDDEEAAVVLDEHIETVEDEEDEHYRWAMKQVENLSLRDTFREGLAPVEGSPPVDVEAEQVESSAEDEAEESGDDEEAA